MAGDAAPKSYVSYADFLAMERESVTRHEWLDGVIYKYPESTIAHAGLSAAVSAEIHNNIRGNRCSVYSCNLRLRVLATGFSTYPDLTVVCKALELDPEDAEAVTNPKLITEIFSPATEARDRGHKFEHYRRIPSLAEYVLISESKPYIEVWRKNAAGKWELAEEALAGQTAQLASIECSLSVDKIYADPLSAA